MLDLDAFDGLLRDYPDEIVIDTATVKALIAELRKLREESRWIPVEERLPEPPGRVLAAYNGRTVCVTYRQGFFENGYRIDPSHWQEMPKPPEVK